jgi:hypothetical protein
MISIQLLSNPDLNEKKNRDENNHYSDTMSEKKMDKSVSVGSSLSYQAFKSLTRERDV